jgi:NAD(P)-dependent dehydrogenase (short-subunit alcohol dehydrogenase family)
MGSKTASGYDMQWVSRMVNGAHEQGTNVVGHFVFAKELIPSLKTAAKTGVPDATRVVWTSSNGHNWSPKGFINFEDVNLPKGSNFIKYGQSKAVCPTFPSVF